MKIPQVFPFLFLIGLLLTSCTPEGPSLDQKLMGTWKFVATESPEETEEIASETIEFTFKPSEFSVNDNGRGTAGTWTRKDSVLSMTAIPAYSEEPVTEVFRVVSIDDQAMVMQAVDGSGPKLFFEKKE